MIVLAIVLPLGAIMPWKRATLMRSAKPLRAALILSVAVMVLVWSVSTGRSAIAVIGAGLGAWLIAGAAAELIHRTGRSGLSRLVRLPRADWGKAVAHSGLGVTFIGVGLLTAWQTEDIRVAQIGEPFDLSGYQITLTAVDEVQGPNYVSTMATMQVARDGRQVATMHPEKRVYPVQAMPTTEAAIDNGIFRDIYLVIGDAQADGGWAVRSYIKPFANWIWAGSILMALGGLISLSDRRYRVAAGARRAHANAVPAE